MSPNVKILYADRKTRALIRKAVLHHKLDRRFVYTVCPDSYLSVACKFTSGCSGCVAQDGSQLGCKECGYTGKRVVHFPAPVEIKDMPMIKVGRGNVNDPEWNYDHIENCGDR